MTYMALPVARREMPNLGVVTLIVLALMSVVAAVSSPEAFTAEYQTTAIALP
jgi:hypothetical protein